MKSEKEVRSMLKYLARQPGLSDRHEGWELALSWMLGDTVPTPIEDDLMAGGR